ncbi:MAG: FHA domain-containing protein [Anaerolineae bacterium]
MRISLRLLIMFCLIFVLVISSTPAVAQDMQPPVVDILGRPDTRSDPPNAHAYVSVVDPATARLVEGLGDANFSVQVSEEDVSATTASEPRGLAVAIVIDRGGIAQRGDPRIGSAVDLTGSLLEMLSVDGSPTADMVALIGVRGEEGGGLTPLVNFTDFDPNLIVNEFDALRTEIVAETTPLYEGLDRAIAWIRENPDPSTAEKVARRRSVIVVFSDGIDRNFSNEAYETQIVSDARENDILIYAIRMQRGGVPTTADNLEAMAVQTGGGYMTHTPETQEAVLEMFQNVVTQRQAYRVTFPLIRPQGDYQVRIRVLDVLGGVASASTSASSRLQPARIALMPPAQTSVTVPYSETLDSFLSTTVDLSVELTAPDGVAREPAEVSYYANQARIGTSSSPPSYPFQWDVTDLESAGDEPITKTFTLMARTTDPYLETTIESAPVDIEIVWEEEELSTIETVEEVVTETWYESWWVLVLFGLLAIGLIILLVMLIKTRGQVAQRAVKSATGVLKGVTQRLGAGGSAPAKGKLVVTQGPNAGREFRLSANIVKVGRDPQFSDFALHDQFVSNPHFSVIEEQNQFFIQDEGSTNGTRLNGAPLNPHQRVPLAPDAIVELGQTRIQFKRLGGPTRQLGMRSGEGSRGRGAEPTPYASPASPQQSGGGDDDRGQEPTQVWRPNDR